VTAGELTKEVLEAALPGRDIHFYPTVVSTEADAMARCRTGAAPGTLVVAEHQISARSRPRRPWFEAPRSLSFSLVMRPLIAPIRAGILYLVATAAVAQIGSPELQLEWPDEAYDGDQIAARVSVHVESTVRGVEWALINVMLIAPLGPREEQLARLVDAIEATSGLPPELLLADWLPRCRTIGRRVKAVLYPVGAGRIVEGRAVGARSNGSLLIDVGAERHVPIAPDRIASIEIIDR
jgi:BirA family biotin operon repressor/biotin-[acetyl-CoA-carboxylase] ligase